MQSKGRRAIMFGTMIFMGILISKLISNDPFTIHDMLGPVVGGLVGGLVIYFLGNYLRRKKH